ncbi:UNVERIFIED_CONTAM: hypothetical protein FKN15_030244 [Acipenser sinensis]
MADVEKTEELVNSKTPPETPLEVAARDKTLKTETSPSEKEGDGLLQTDPGLLSAMPCLLMELRRDSPESQQASTESEKQMPSRTYESDSSNHCMLSPSSSGHLADSDTLSSAEENGAPRAGASCAAEGGDSNSGAVGMVVAGGRKSRRLRSESEMSSMTSMAAKKNRWQVTRADKQNGQLAKVKGHRSQKHKERIRLLRQKREAAARKKYNLLQDSSTSDSDLTCDSSTSSSDDDKEVSGSGKTITGNIPDGPPVLAHYDISDTNSDPEVVSVNNLLAAAVAQELKTYRTQDMGANSWQNKGDLGSNMETVQPLKEWDIDAVSRDASDILEGESIESEIASQHSEQDIALQVLDTDDPTWSVVERATRHLKVEWPMTELPRRSLFESPSAQPHQSRMLLAFPDFIKEVQSTWGAPVSAPATSRKAAVFNMQGASEAGLASFPPVDAAFAALVQTPTLWGLTKDPACPNKQCRTTEVHLKKGYAAATEAVRLSNVASLLTVYQAAHARDLPECPSADLRSELVTVSQLLVRLAQLNAQA